MSLRPVALATSLLFASGCTFTTHGSSSGAARPEHQASHKPRRPARPQIDDREKKPPKENATPAPKPEPAQKPEPKPPAAKPEPKPPAVKPEPKPEPPVAEPKPPRKPKPQPPFKPTPEEPKAKPIKGMDGFVTGKPKGLKPSMPDAYWVWQDESGWHLRTTTDTPDVRRFTGRLWLEEGTLTGVAGTRVELKDRFKQTGQALEFDFETMGDIDGFDFQVTGAKCLRFKLLIDDKAKPNLIHVGRNKVSPPAATFAICP